MRHVTKLNLEASTRKKLAVNSVYKKLFGVLLFLFMLIHLMKDINLSDKMTSSGKM